MTITKLQRYQGALLGLATGDAIGTSVEFKPRGSFTPVKDMTGGGAFRLKAGEWTDDTSMALCLAASLLEQGFSPTDQMNRYVNWWRYGYMSSNGRCFDIGGTTSGALRRYELHGDVFAGDTDDRAAGNGALMRLAPIPMCYGHSAEATWLYAGESTRTTHGSREAIECSQLFAMMLRTALGGGSKKDILETPPLVPLSEKVQDIADGTYKRKAIKKIKGSGYCVESLEAALWCFSKTNTFEDAVLAAANLGDDADTTAAITGQIAGAFYGVKAIKPKWRKKLVKRELMMTLASDLMNTSDAL